MAELFPVVEAPTASHPHLGKWKRVSLSFTNTNVAIRIDGKEVATRPLRISSDANATFGLEDAGAELTYANFYLRELPRP